MCADQPGQGGHDRDRCLGVKVGKVLAQPEPRSRNMSDNEWEEDELLNMPLLNEPTRSMNLFEETVLGFQTTIL
jgi:hypothetical protein